MAIGVKELNDGKEECSMVIFHSDPMRTAENLRTLAAKIEQGVNKLVDVKIELEPNDILCLVMTLEK